jgi:dihydrolipoamide dehydrogenase
LAEIPRSLVVIGGGYIGIEIGQMYAKFGSKVTVLENGENILSGIEKEQSQWVGRALKKQRVDVFTQAVVQDVKQSTNDVTVVYAANGELAQVTADYVLVTIGRRPNTDELGISSLGIATNKRGFIEIDSQCRTSVPNVYAIGDIVKGPALAHKASYEGKVAAEAIAGLPSAIDYKAIPAIVFSDPEIATVGLNEVEARKAGIAVSVGKFPYAANGRALAMEAGEGFVKVIADESSGLVLGAQIVGAESSNLIAELALAIEMGARMEDIALTVHAHPTLGEMAMEAAEAAMGRPTHLVVSKKS